MILIDEYLAIRVLGGAWPDGLPDDDLGLTASRHWRLLQRIHAPAGGQLSQRLGALPVEDLGVVRHPHPEVLQILDSGARGARRRWAPQAELERFAGWSTRRRMLQDLRRSR